MNLFAKLHERWAANATLNGLLDSSLVATGTWFDVEPSLDTGYATITRQTSDSVISRSSDGTREEKIQIRITVYVSRDKYDEGESIADAAKSAFGGASFDLDGTDSVKSIMLTGYQPIDDEEGDWYFILDFICTVTVGE
jgi:hypothetical protein